jgi:hypothetical protein
MEKNMHEFRGQGFRAWSHHQLTPDTNWLDIIVETGQGSFIATLYTVAGLEQALAECAQDGLNCGGSYFFDSGMVVVRSLDEITIRTFVEDMVRGGRIPEVFVPCRKAGEDSDAE